MGNPAEEAATTGRDRCAKLLPVVNYPNFEHPEAEGQRLLPEQLMEMLKALA